MGKPSRVTVAPKQSLGQNFLTDDNIARNIVLGLKLRDQDVIIEIGPGHGALTRHLAGHARHVTAVEIDGRVIGDLEEKFGSSGVEILHADFLTLSLAELSARHSARLRIVGNIPYHLTSSILFKTFDEHDALHDLTIMVQREVARRIVARPSTKEYGILSVVSRFYGTPELFFNVSPNCFYPKPNVTSTVLRIAFHEKLPYTVDTKLFREIVKTTFGKRRKKLRNSLAYLPYEPEYLQATLEATNAMFERRPEELSTEEFAELTLFLQERLPWQKNTKT